MQNSNKIDASIPTAVATATTSSQESKETATMTTKTTQPSAKPASFAALVRNAKPDAVVAIDAEGTVTIGGATVIDPHARILKTLAANGIRLDSATLKVLLLSGAYRCIRVDEATNAMSFVTPAGKELHGATVTDIAHELLQAHYAAAKVHGLAIVVEGKYGDKIALMESGTFPLDRFAEASVKDGAAYNAYVLETPMGDTKKSLAVPLFFEEVALTAEQALKPFGNALAPPFAKQVIKHLKGLGIEVPEELLPQKQVVTASGTTGKDFTTIVKKAAIDSLVAVEGDTVTIGAVKVEGQHARILGNLMRAGLGFTAGDLKVLLQSGVYRAIRFTADHKPYVASKAGNAEPLADPVALAKQVLRDLHAAAPANERAVVPIVSGKHGDMLAIMPNGDRVAVDHFLDGLVKEGAYYPVRLARFGQGNTCAVPLYFEEAELGMQEACRANGVRLPMPYLLQVRQHVALKQGGAVVKGAEEQAVAALRSGQTLRLGNLPQ